MYPWMWIGVPMIFAIIGIALWEISNGCPHKDGGRGTFRCMSIAFFAIAVYITIHYIKIGLL